MNKRKIGKMYEDFVINFLQHSGYGLVTRNYCVRGGEIDLIMIDPSGQLVFVEVKGRKDSQYCLPETSLNYKKITRLKYAVWKYLEKEKVYDDNFRIDLIVCEGVYQVDIRHYKGVVTL